MKHLKRIISLLLAVCILAFPVSARADINEKFHEDITVLFIGNSITYHEQVPGLWDAAWGMCASTPQRDFVHQTGKRLKRAFDGAEFYFTKMANWECPPPGATRFDYAQKIIKSLAVQPDVVVLQLGENVLDDSAFIPDFMYVIESIRQTLPDAKLVMVGNTVSDWCSPNVEAEKISVAAYYGIPYVDATPIRDNPLYQAGMNYTFQGLDGQIHPVPNIGVAHHLNDDGMAWLGKEVADQIIELYRIEGEAERGLF